MNLPLANEIRKLTACMFFFVTPSVYKMNKLNHFPLCSYGNIQWLAEFTMGREQISKSKIQPKAFTSKQKEKIIKRFNSEMQQREDEFKANVDKEISLLRLKFKNRLNKILRKFWDVKIEDILNVERELHDEAPLTLLNVIKQLEASKTDHST